MFYQGIAVAAPTLKNVTIRNVASCVCQHWRVVVFVDLTWNVEASSNLHQIVCFLSKLAPI